MKKNTIRVSDKYIRSLIREAIENMPDMPVSTDVSTDGMGAETTGEDDEEPVSENGGQIRLSESQLREFVSYSVARLLRESRYLRAPEGDGSFELDFGPYEQDGMEEAVNQAMAKSGLSEEWLEENDPFPVKVRISYGITPGSDDDQVLGLPGNTDDTELTGWEIMSPVDPSINGFVREAVGIYLKSADFDLDGELVGRGILRESAENPGSQGMYAGNRGLSEEEEDDEALNPVLTGSHEKVGSLPDIPNKYEGMTWDEYVEAKKREREEDERKAKKGLDPVLKGGKGGSFGGNRKSDDKRKDETRLTSEDLAEMVRKTTRALMERTLREETDSLGQYHGSLRLDQEGDFARKIFAVMGDIEDQMADIEQRVEADEDYDDQNTYNYYSALKSAYNALDSLAHFEDADY